MNIYDRWYEAETDKVLTVFRKQEHAEPEQTERPAPRKADRHAAKEILRGAMVAMMGAGAIAALLGEFQTAAACILLGVPLGTAWLGYSM